MARPSFADPRPSRAWPRLIAAVLLAAAPVCADGLGADALIEQGVQLREQGHDDRALALFQRAYALVPTPRARAQVALAEQALGQWLPAERDLRDALAAQGDPWIEGRRSVLANALSMVSAHLGSLEVLGGIEGAEVFVDGKKIGALPMPEAMHVEAGTATLEVRAPGRYPISRTMVVKAGEVTRETVDLSPLPAEKPAAGPPPLASPPVVADAPATAAPAVRPESASVQRTLGWAGLAAAGAGVAVGIIGVALEQSNVSAYNADKTCPGTATLVQPPACASRISAEAGWKTASIVGFAAGGVLAATSVVLVLTAPRARASGAVSCNVGVGSVACGVAF